MRVMHVCLPQLQVIWSTSCLVLGRVFGRSGGRDRVDSTYRMALLQFGHKDTTSRSSNVIDFFDTNRKRVYIFLLVVNSNRYIGENDTRALYRLDTI